MEKVDSIDRLAEIVEDQSLEVGYSLELIDEDRPLTKRLLIDEAPGDKIRNMMEEWEKIPIDSNDDIEAL